MFSLLRSELTKALSLPSIAITTLAAVVVPPLLALVTGLNFQPTDHRWDGFPIESHGFEVAGFGQPLVILVAALIAGTEFTDHQLRTTLTATPRRLRLLLAKLAIIAGVAAVIAAVATTAAVVLKHAALGEHGLAFSEFTAGMAWNLVGVIANYVMIALIAAGLTVITRSFIVTLIVLVPMVLGLTMSLVQVVPALKFLPDLAGLQLLTGYPGMGLLDPIPGAQIMLAWVLALSAAAVTVLIRRDVNG